MGDESGFKAVWPFVLIALVSALALPVPVMEVDAAQYASMAREMLTEGNWLQLFNRHEPYLDKPPLLFWLSAASFKLFGFNNFAYKLPSLLFAWLALYAVYRLARLYYEEGTAYNAALLLGSVLSFFLMTNDVRTDTLLMSCVIVGTWLLAEYFETHKVSYLVFGFLFVGMAMLSKGPIGLVTPGLALGFHVVLKKKWGVLSRPAFWFIGLPVLALTLLPMLYGLYTQYGTEGIYFFFWKQSFGRLTGENVWDNDGGLSFFFVHTFLWAFLPWTLLALGGAWLAFRKIIKIEWGGAEWISLGGFVLPFIALSFSRYKLPHYIYVTFPFAAILAARFLETLFDEKKEKYLVILSRLHLGLAWLLVVLVLVLCAWAFPLQYGFLAVVTVLFIAVMFFMMHRVQGDVNRLVALPFTALILVNILLATHLYPSLLQYQSSNAAAKLYLNSRQLEEPLYALHEHGHALDFYSGRIVPLLLHAPSAVSLAHQQPYWLYTDAAGYDTLKAAPVSIATKFELQDYPVTKLTPLFLNPATRKQVVKTRYLLRITPQ